MGFKMIVLLKQVTGSRSKSVGEIKVFFYIYEVCYRLLGQISGTDCIISHLNSTLGEWIGEERHLSKGDHSIGYLGLAI